MTAQFPGTQRADLQVVRDDDQAADTTTKALGLLENARKVADSAAARPAPARLLAAARERSAQVQRDAKELGQKMRTDAERETAQARHQAYGEAERIVADARSEVSNLKASVAGLREERDAAETSMRELSERLQGALQAYAAPVDQSPSEGEHHHQ
jgi:chromosome segregation ATPase